MKQLVGFVALSQADKKTYLCIGYNFIFKQQEFLDALNSHLDNTVLITE